MKIFILFLIGMMFVSTSYAEEASFTYQDKGKRDPFWPLVTGHGLIVNFDKDLLISDIVLEGIMTDNDGGNIAIVNGKILNVGEKVGLFVIKEIYPHAVILQKGEEQYKLKLKKGGLK